MRQQLTVRPRPRFGGDIDRTLDVFERALDDVMTLLGSKVDRRTSSKLLIPGGSAQNIINAESDVWTMVKVNGTSFVIRTPPSPTMGETFNVKNVSSDGTSFNIDSGHDQIEDPASLGTFVSGSFAVSGSGVALQWTWMGQGDDARWYKT